MPRVADILFRFRPAGAPGAASAAGVPVDRAADAEAELAPVFAELDEVERECAARLAEADRAAETARQQALARAESIEAEARQRCEAERAAAAARQRRRADDEAAALMQQARRSADELTRRAADDLPGYVGQVVEAVRSTLGGDRASALR